jgi:hypothetical protein
MSSAETQLAVPSVEDLCRMTGVPDKRVVIRDVDWAFYAEQVIIERLGDDGCYHSVESSGF